MFFGDLGKGILFTKFSTLSKFSKYDEGRHFNISILKKLGYEKLINIQEGFKGIRETNLNISCFNSL